MKPLAEAAVDLILRKRATVTAAGRTEEFQVIESVADAGVYLHDEFIPQKQGGKFKNLHFLPWSDITRIVVRTDDGKEVEFK